MNNTYLYDGEFSSLLKLIGHLIKLKEKPGDIKSEKNYVPNLLDKPVYLEAKEDYLQLDKTIKSRIYYTYLSTDKNKELIIYYFIKNYLIYKNTILYRRNLNCVNKVLDLSLKVSREAHKMKGFLRFKKMDGFYYGEISPTNDVLPIIVNHFIKRLNDKFMIKDKNRNKYVIYDLNNTIFLEEKDIISLNIDKNKNDSFEDLWKTFFNTIAIKERENRKAQKSFMPKKYWNDMLEMEDNL